MHVFSGSEKESLPGKAGHAGEEIQTGADRDAAAAGGRPKMRIAEASPTAEMIRKELPYEF